MRLNWSMKHWGKVNKPLISLVLFPKIHWKDWCWSWNSDTLATWCKELTHLERPWCWKRLKAGGEGDDRGWHGWMASPTQWTWVWINSGSCWWTERPGVLQSMGLWRVEHDWAAELNWFPKTSFLMFHMQPLVEKNLPANGGDKTDEGWIPESRKFPWRRAWQPTPVFLPGESHGERSLAGYSLWGRKEPGMTEVT